MALQILNKNQLPPEIAQKIRDDESVYHFTYADIAGKGGCGSPKVEASKEWFVVTNERVFYQASIKQSEGGRSALATTYFKLESGSIPVAKISFVAVTSDKKFIDGKGCSGKYAEIGILSINSGGGKVEIAIPTIAEAQRIQSVIDDLVAKKN